MNISLDNFLNSKEKILSTEGPITISDIDIFQNSELKPKYYFNKSSDDKITFISFGNEQYKKALYRICSQALSMPSFKRIIIYNQDSLINDKEFWRQNGDFILNNPRGYGYWIWKSYIVMKTLEKLNSDEFLIYCDAGCIINNSGHQRLKEYISIVKEHPSGVLAFKLTNPWNTESKYTKMDVIKEMNADHLLHTYQNMATIVIMRKTDTSLNITKQWYELSSKHNLINNETNVIPNMPDFIEHRNDQSFYSLLTKQYNVAIIPDDTEGNSPLIPLNAARIRND